MIKAALISRSYLLIAACFVILIINAICIILIHNYSHIFSVLYMATALRHILTATQIMLAIFALYKFIKLRLRSALTLTLTLILLQSSTLLGLYISNDRDAFTHQAHKEIALFYKEHKLIQSNTDTPQLIFLGTSCHPGRDSTCWLVIETDSTGGMTNETQFLFKHTPQAQILTNPRWASIKSFENITPGPWMLGNVDVTKISDGVFSVIGYELGDP